MSQRWPTREPTTRGSCARPVWVLAVALLVIWRGTAPAGAEEPRLLSVAAGRDGSLLVCHLQAGGLPGEKISLSLRSGLVSSIELFLDLLDANEKVVAENRITFQLAFDLWEEVFSVEGLGVQRRFADQAELAAFLAEPPRLPVAPVAVLNPGGAFRLRAGLFLHPIAPLQRERVGDVIAGNPAGQRTAMDRQEVSFGLGSLIRFFYRRRPEPSDPELVRLSPWFRPEELIDAPD